ncbi:flavodoxin family protein [Parafrankia sp. EUN1f]|uniref:flavodoxin family protein n=1 Tax=Parafrankia sp. EUN1f TaxID=102897 RepID=UPI0001C468D7|nr:flavodoxin family protein [Parafrankia sp. EUN1f]EFC80423.1 hypothetical protein FrEUN1fDRAFT_6476 [Parafrankia sp. EUN1f]
MAILIVTESYFGNTLMIARSIAAGLARVAGAESVTVVGPDRAAAGTPADLKLLVVGAPTHGFSMPRQQSRRQAVEKGAVAGEEPGAGVREWIERIALRPDLRVVSFDTSVKMRFQPGTASKAIFRALRKRGFRYSERGPSFYVTGTEGPLVDGEVERAERWGAQLGRSLKQKTV